MATVREADLHRDGRTPVHVSENAQGRGRPGRLRASRPRREHAARGLGDGRGPRRAAVASRERGSGRWSTTTAVVRARRMSGPGLRFRAARGRRAGPRPRALSPDRRGPRVQPRSFRAACRRPRRVRPTCSTAAAAGALAAVAAAGRRTGVPYALDLEDFHSAERDDDALGPSDRRAGRADRARRLAGRRLSHRRAAPRSRPPMRRSTASRPSPSTTRSPCPRGLRLSSRAPATASGSTGSARRSDPRRGLEDAVRGMGRGGIPGELHLRGRAIPAVPRRPASARGRGGAAPPRRPSRARASRRDGRSLPRLRRRAVPRARARA